MKGRGDVRIEPMAVTDPAALELIAALDAELDARYPEPGANHFRLDADEVAPGRGAFLIARDRASEKALGCGAVRVNEGGVGEVKRMFVRPSARGRSIGRLLLEALEAEARKLGVRRLVLEAGERQVEAIGLYERAGFVRIERFGEYVDSPHSVCMGKTISGSTERGV